MHDYDRRTKTARDDKALLEAEQDREKALMAMLQQGLNQDVAKYFETVKSAIKAEISRLVRSMRRRALQIRKLEGEY